MSVKKKKKRATKPAHRSSSELAPASWLDASPESVAVTLTGDSYATKGMMRKRDFDAVRDFCDKMWLEYGERI